MPTPKNKANKVNKSDYDRVLVTETLPFETPMIFSNDGLYKLLKSYDKSCRVQRILIGNLVLGEGLLKPVNSTIPFSYKIRKNEKGHRELGLMHPSSQYKVRRFYEKYEHLLLYHCSLSPASIRSPEKISGSYYIRSGFKYLNQYKSNSVMNVQLDELTLNTPSYYAYKGVTRLYKYFESRDFFETEKKYGFMATLDVSHCFPSIYTHGMSWALKGKEFTKRHVSVSTSFSQEFDELMRHMNFGETNGILIGPEVSRIFAEVIFQSIDATVINRLKSMGYSFDKDFVFRRYVDDIYIFASSKDLIEKVSETISDELSKQNLYINSQKSQLIGRPFVTKKSKLINKAKAEASSFIRSFTSFDRDKKTLSPSDINSTWKLTRSYLTRVKTLCSDSETEYSEVSGFLIGFFCERVKKLVSIEEGGNPLNEEVSANYYKALLVLLEIQFFLYQVSPSVQSSYKFCTSLILIIRFCKKHISFYSADIEQRIFELTEELILEMQDSVKSSVPGRVMLEKINVVLAISELNEPNRLRSTQVEFLFSSESEDDYFTIVSGLYYVKNIGHYSGIKGVLLSKASQKLSDLSDIFMSSEKSYLLLDLLSCPYVPVNKKQKWIKRAFKTFKERQPSNNEISSFLSNAVDFTSNVNWVDLDLLNSLERKELNATY